MRYLIIILLFVSCSSDFNYPDECERHNIQVERNGRVMEHNLNIRCADGKCTEEEYQQGLDDITEYINDNLCRDGF